jgi:predicted PurR-regulated permease PerM
MQLCCSMAQVVRTRHGKRQPALFGGTSDRPGYLADPDPARGKTPLNESRALRRRRGGLTIILWTQLGALLGFSALLFLSYQLYQVFQPFLAPIAWAIILRFAFQPVHDPLRRRLPNRPNLVALLATAVVTLAVAIPALAISSILTHEAAGAVEHITRFLQAGGLERWGEQLRELAWIPLWRWLSPWFDTTAIDLRGILLRALNSGVNVLVEQMTIGAASLLVIVVKFILMLLTLFFVFRDGETFYNWVRSTLPFAPSQQEHVFTQLAQTVNAVSYGIGITAVVQGLLAGLLYWILGVPFPAFWGLLTGIVAPIPIGGTGLIWAPAGVYLILAESFVRGVILLACGVLVVSTIDNVLKAYLISGRTRLPPLILFFAILGGLKAYGVLGVFVGPLLLALVITGVTLYRDINAQRRPVIASPS